MRHWLRVTNRKGKERRTLRYFIVKFNQQSWGFIELCQASLVHPREPGKNRSSVAVVPAWSEENIWAKLTSRTGNQARSQARTFIWEPSRLKVSQTPHQAGAWTLWSLSQWLSNIEPSCIVTCNCGTLCASSICINAILEKRIETWDSSFVQIYSNTSVM